MTTIPHPTKAMYNEMNSIGTPVRESSIRVIIDQIQRNLEHHEKALAVLGERISPAMTPETPQPCSPPTGATAIRPQPAPICEPLETIQRHVSRLTERLEDFTRRCEL